MVNFIHDEMTLEVRPLNMRDMAKQANFSNPYLGMPWPKTEVRVTEVGLFGQRIFGPVLDKTCLEMRGDACTRQSPYLQK